MLSFVIWSFGRRKNIRCHKTYGNEGIEYWDIKYAKIYFITPQYLFQTPKSMSFQNSYGPDGSININVVPSFGRIVQLPEPQKFVTISEIEQWRAKKGVLRTRPADFDPSRYVSFSTKEVVEDPVPQQSIHEYVERSRLSRRLGF